jgi:hypothetical protein
MGRRLCLVTGVLSEDTYILDELCSEADAVSTNFLSNDVCFISSPDEEMSIGSSLCLFTGVSSADTYILDSLCFLAETLSVCFPSGFCEQKINK